MSNVDTASMKFRPMVAADVGAVPTDCHGAAADLHTRISSLGAAAILAFEGSQHVGQLQFRLHEPGLHSEKGIWSPEYWGDFDGRAPLLPNRTLVIYCYHVGQLAEGKEREARYQGHGLGLKLLDQLIAWAKQNRFEAIAAKAMPLDREVMKFMGGQPRRVYESRNFETVDAWIDQRMYDGMVERGVVKKGSDPQAVAGVALCILTLS